MTAAPETLVHPTAVVMPGAELGAGVLVGPYAVIEPGVEVGDGCRIGPHVHLLGRTYLGRDCRLHAHVVVGDEPQDLKFEGERLPVRIGDRAVLREHATVHSPTSERSGETVVGAEAMLMVSAHVGHNASLGDRAILVNNSCLGGHASVGEGAIISGGAMVHQYCRVGRLALLGGGTMAVRDVPPFALVTGSYPSRLRGPNTVGLRRAEVAEPTRNRIRRAFQVLREEGPDATIAAVAANDWDDAELAELVAFLATTERGVVWR